MLAHLAFDVNLLRVIDILIDVNTAWLILIDHIATLKAFSLFDPIAGLDIKPCATIWASGFMATNAVD
jgi:hypothetical protein